MDSGYACKQLLQKAAEKRITMIGALKTNRVLFPNGKRCPAYEYAASLPNGQYHLVAVGGHEYWIHRYEDPLTGAKNAVVLLSYGSSTIR